MNIIENINKKLVFDEEEICAGGENDIEEIIRVSPVSLPKDYIDFLKQVSGEDSYGPEFEVEGEGLSIWIWSAKMALEKLEEFNQPFISKFMYWEHFSEKGMGVLPFRNFRGGMAWTGENVWRHSLKK